MCTTISFCLSVLFLERLPMFYVFLAKLHRKSLVLSGKKYCKIDRVEIMEPTIFEESLAIINKPFWPLTLHP